MTPLEARCWSMTPPPGVRAWSKTPLGSRGLSMTPLGAGIWSMTSLGARGWSMTPLEARRLVYESSGSQEVGL